MNFHYILGTKKYSCKNTVTVVVVEGYHIELASLIHSGLIGLDRGVGMTQW